MTQFNPSAVDVKAVSLQQAINELMREIRLREGVYAKWVADEKLPIDQANKQFGGIAKAHKSLLWLQDKHQDVMLGLSLVSMLRQAPETVGVLFTDPAVKALLEAFPDAQLTHIREIGKVAA